MKMKKADVAVAIYIMAAIIMFIVPIPSWLLDILLAINISVALTIRVLRPEGSPMAAVKSPTRKITVWPRS